jgi:TPR repeat protein
MDRSTPGSRGERLPPVHWKTKNDPQNSFSICLKDGRSVEQNFEMTPEYYQIAAEYGHSEAKFNRVRCLLGQWKPPDRSSESVSHPLPKSRTTGRR